MRSFILGVDRSPNPLAKLTGSNETTLGRKSAQNFQPSELAGQYWSSFENDPEVNDRTKHPRTRRLAHPARVAEPVDRLGNEQIRK